MKKRKWLMPWICVCFLMAGIFLSFYDTFFCTEKGKVDAIAIKFSRQDQIQAVVCICILAAVFVYGIYVLQTKFALAGGALLVIAGVVMAVVKRNSIASGIRFVNYLYKNRMASYEHTSPIRIQTWKTLPADVFWLEMLLGVILLFYVTVFVLRMHSKGYLCLFDIAALSQGMVFGRTPQVSGVIWLVFGSIGLFVLMSREERGVKGAKKIVFLQKDAGNKWVFAITAVLCILLLWSAHFYALRFEKNYFKGAQEARDQNEVMARRMENTGKNLVQMLFESAIIDNTGHLTNREPEYTESTVLKVNLSKIPDQPVYLRGFTGDRYQNGKWSARSYQTVEDKLMEHFLGAGNVNDDAMLSGIWDMGFQIAQISDVMTDEDMMTDSYASSAVSSSMHIEYVGAGRRSKYTYLPYFSSASDAFSNEDDGDWTQDQNYYLQAKGDNHCIKKDNEFQVGCTLLSTNEEEALYRYAKKLDSDIDVLPFSFSSEFYTTYQKLANRYYTQMPKDGLSSFYYIAKQAKNIKSEWKKAEFVKNYLRNNAVYSMDLKPVPKGTDYAEYFLLVQKKGYCEHFATAGTLLLRACGVPARYVTGYRVDPKEFKKDPDGGYTAEVKDSDSHAWSEIYIKNMGWVCKEMTPAVNAFNNASSVKAPGRKSSVRKDQNTKETGQKEKNQTVKPTKTANTTAQPEKKENPLTKHRKTAAWRNVLVQSLIIIVLLCVAIITAFRVYLLLYRRSIRKERDLCKQEQKRLQSTYRFVRMAGIREKKNCTDSEWMLEIAQRMRSQEMTGLAQKLSKEIERLAFSAKKPTQSDAEEWNRQLQKMEKLVYKEASLRRKLLLKLFGYTMDFKEKYDKKV